MKKLIMAAAAVALVGGVFAAPVYSYKASVKYTDLKKLSTIKYEGQSYTGTFYIKVLKTASLTGYFVADPHCPCELPGQAKNGMLVIENKSAKSGVKLLPANLYVQICRTAANKFLAEGYLFAGKGGIAAAAATAPDQGVNGWGDDQWWTTVKLFGAYNTPTAKTNGTFYDCWLDAAGFGTAAYSKDDDEGCYIGEEGICLNDLAGSVIGGLFQCHLADGWERPTPGVGLFFLCKGWANTTAVISGTWSIKSVGMDEVALAAAETDKGITDTEFNRLIKAAAVKVGGKNYKLTDDSYIKAAFWGADVLGHAQQ
jgi:hypothetical protein